MRANEFVTENLRDWFKEKWVRFGPDGKIRGDCARGKSSEGKPKCLPQSKAQALGKKGRASAAAKKRREDPNPERRGAAKNVATKVREGAMKDLHTELADKYRELAPKIEKYKDSFLAGQLYDALEAIANEHGAEQEFKRMMTGARNRAHMDYDTNPGGFQNWFWYLPLADEDITEENQDDRNARIIAGEIEDAMSQGNQSLAQQKIKDLTKLGYYFDKQGKLQRMGMYEAGVDEGRNIIPAETTIANAKKLWQYVQRNLDDLASNSEFDRDYNKLFIDEKLDGLFKTAAGEPVQVAFDNGSNIEVDNGILYIPIEMMYYYRHIMSSQQFVQRVVQALDQTVMAEEQLQEKQDACYHKVKSRYKVWPSAYASGALVQCRKKGAANWGNKGKK
jgi:hypothetical protein